VIQQTGFREQKHAAAKRADQSPGGVLAAQPCARLRVLRLQSFNRRVIDEASGHQDGVAGAALADGAVHRESQAASHPHRFAVERQCLPAEADLAASEMHDMVGQRQEVGHAGHGRVHAAFQHQNRELHGSLQTV